ncbi:MAG: F0F1 ATP synthase subunit B [Planctomycetota bacterium]
MLPGFLGGLLLASEEAAGEPDPLYWSNDLAFFTLIIFIGLLLILTRFAWKPIIAGLDAREKGIANDIESARIANEKAQANLKQYEDKLASVQDEAAAIIAEAKEDALATKERIVGEAKEEASREKEKAFADIRSAKDAAVRELAEKSVDSAVALAGSIVSRSLKKDDHTKLIEDAVAKFKSGSGA